MACGTPISPQFTAARGSCRDRCGYRSVCEREHRHRGRREILSKQRASAGARQLRTRREGCAEVVNALLDAAPGLRILVTSREALSIDGETVRRLASLGVDESVCLFQERARSVAPQASLDDDAVVGRIARNSRASRSRSSWRPHVLPLNPRQRCRNDSTTGSRYCVRRMALHPRVSSALRAARLELSTARPRGARGLSAAGRVCRRMEHGRGDCRVFGRY